MGANNNGEHAFPAHPAAVTPEWLTARLRASGALEAVSGPDGEQGVGVFEQLTIGPYDPLGLRGLADPA